MRLLRITLSIVLFVFITAYFIDFAGLLPDWLHKLEDIQLIPALLSLNGIIILALVVLTLVFGRIYCSSVCPLGVYQDIVSRLRKWTSTRKNRKRYKFLPPLNWLRYGFLALTIAGFITGLHVLVGLLDPYSAFGRITVHLFKPVYQAGNNLLFSIFTSFDDHTFYKISIYLLSIASLVTALVTLLTVSILAWRNGRIYCNTVCPAGTLLGLLSRFSLFQIRFDSQKCTLCGSCARECKSSCIDFKQLTVDSSRCVTCFNCIDSCKESGLKYRLPRKGESLLQRPTATRLSTRDKAKFANTIDSNTATITTIASNTIDSNSFATNTTAGNHSVISESAITTNATITRLATASGETTNATIARTTVERENSANAAGRNDAAIRTEGAGRRRFLIALGVTGVAVARLSAEITLKLGPKKKVARTKAIMPPGAGTFEHFTQRCTSCHLCIAKCPTQVIKPAFLDYGPGGILQPMMNFDHQFCNYDCTLCSDVCPTDALMPLTQEAKHHNQMGIVQLYLENCIVYTDETSCGACSEHCPTQAVHMVHYKDSLTIPEINPAICVGCGGCEYVCPAKPWKAIFVEGLTAHNTIELEFEEEEEHVVDSFGF